MEPDRTERVRELFLAARALDSGERIDFLRRATAGDLTLAQEVGELLKAEEADANFLESPALGRGFREQAVETVVATHEEQQLERIGPYRVLELIGEGGFARVYAAQQESPVRRRVAIKLLKPGVATAQVVRRFEAEGQHLASMDHPAIARIFDAGTTEDGRPYFIMEYVRGVTIIEFCRQSRRSLRQQLDLFLQVCDAVHYAHQRGVIHRDLKPSNILIDTSGANPVPKVIDFGVAKTIVTGSPDETAHTQVGQLIGTPEYMSPEQAGGASVDVDTRTDVYSLGVVLYEILTGSRPLVFTQDQRSDWLRMVRVICEQEPLKPSTRISSVRSTSSQKGQATVTASHPPPPVLQTERERSAMDAAPAVPPTPARNVRGDLDWIVMQCLEKQRTDRYESVADLAADIRRYFACEPVLAGPPSTLYRLVKFVRKHRVPVAGGALLLALLAVAIGAAIHSVIQGARAEAADARAFAAREQERAASERSRTYVEVLESFLSAPVERGYATTVLDVMRDCEQILEEGQLSTEAEAHIRLRLGENWRSFGDYNAAFMHLTQARELYAAIGDRLNAARTGLVVAYLHSDLESLFVAGPLDNPETLIDECLKQVPTANSETWEVRAELLLLRSMLNVERDSDAARDTLNEAEDLVRQWAQGETSLHGRCLALDAFLRAQSGDSARVLSDLQDAHAIMCRTLGAAHRDALALLTAYGEVAEMLGRVDQAEREFSDAIDELETQLGPEHPRVSAAFVHRAGMRFRTNNRDVAESDIETALALCAKRIESADPAWLHTAQYCVKIAARHRARLEDAESLAQHVLAAIEEVFGSGSRQLITPLNHLNAVRYVSEQYTPETVASMQREIRLREMYLGERDYGRLSRANNLAICLGKQGRFEEALAVLEGPLEIVREDYGDYPFILVSFERLYLSGLMLSEQYARAETFLQEIHQRELELQRNPGYLVLLCEHFADLYAKWGKPTLAAEWREKASLRRTELEQAEQQPKQP